MTAANNQIIALFEDSGMTPEDIALELGMELASIKAVLLSFSQVYREREDKGREDVSEDEYQDILAAYKRLALYGEHEHVRERALRNLINEKKGRNEVKSMVKGDQTINVVILNQSIIAARKAKEKLLNSLNEKPTIDVGVEIATT